MTERITNTAVQTQIPKPQITKHNLSSKEKREEKIEKKIEEKQNIDKSMKSEAVINARGVRISTKHSVALCNFIRNKKVDDAISDLEKVTRMKLPVPMRGEIPHRRGIMSGRYPINTAKEFIRLLKSARSNAIYHELELEKLKIFCMANIANRPYKKFGQRRSKRTHVQIKLVPIGK